MPKVTINTLTGGYGSVDLLNDNFEAIQDAIENTLSRDGTSPNTMEDDIDMDSNRILNLPAPVNGSEPARLLDLQNAVVGTLTSATFTGSLTAATMSVGSGGLTVTGNVVLSGDLQVDDITSDLIAGNTISIGSGGGTLGGTVTATTPAATTDTTQIATTEFVQDTWERPCISVHRNNNNQSIGNGSVTIIQFTHELFDTNNTFNTSTYQFQPTTAGYYFVSALVRWDAHNNGARGIYIYKNGSEYKRGSVGDPGGSENEASIINVLVPMNGTTDYLDVRVIQTSGGSLNLLGDPVMSYMTAHFVRNL